MVWFYGRIVMNFPIHFEKKIEVLFIVLVTDLYGKSGQICESLHEKSLKILLIGQNFSAEFSLFSKKD